MFPTWKFGLFIKPAFKLPATVINIAVSELSVYTDLSEMDLRIIKCILLSGARTEISDIAREVSISEKSTTRRLNRMKEGRLLDFSIQCSPAPMIGYIQYAISNSRYEIPLSQCI